MKQKHVAPDELAGWEAGLLPEEMAAEVAAHLEECGYCRRMREDLRHPALAEAGIGEMERVGRRVERGKGGWRGWWKYGVAAGVLLAAAGIGWQTRPKATVGAGPVAAVVREEKAPVERVERVERLALRKAPLRLPLALAVTMRGQENGQEAYLAALGAAMKAYREDRWAEAERGLAQVAARYPEMVEGHFYAGVARLMQGDAAGARGALERARQIGGEAFQGELEWYLAVAYERSGEWEKAQGLLRRLCQQENAYRSEACAALQ